MITCVRCGTPHEEQDHYLYATGKRDKTCRFCRQDIAREFRRKFPEEQKARAKKSREKHRARNAARCARWHQADPQWTRNWCAQNKDRVSARNRNFRQNHPDRIQYYARRRRTQKLAAVGDATVEQVMARVAFWGSRCWLCHKPYEAIDHVIPLSRGGTNWAANLRPICCSCNSRKGNRDPWPLLNQRTCLSFTRV